MAEPVENENSLEPKKPLRPSSQELFRPLPVAEKMLRIPLYQMKIFHTSISSINRGHFDQIEVYPIESTASLVLSDKKRKHILQIPIANISDINMVSEKIGRIKRVENLMVKIVFRGEDSSENSIMIDLEDKFIDSFMQDVETIRNNVYDNSCWSHRLLTYVTDNNEPKIIDFYPFAPFLAEGEEIIWHYIQTEGWLNKKVTWIDMLTNYRVFEYNFKGHAGNYALISAIEDVVVSNKHRTSSSNSVGSYGKSRYHISGAGSSKTTSTTIGDIDFIAQGKPFIKFAQVSDPYGLAAIVKSLRKQQAKLQISNPVQDNEASQSEPPIMENTLHENNTSPRETTFPIQEITSNENTPQPAEVARYTCIQCRGNNPVGSKFCNKCGSQLLPLCTKCGSSNPTDANFCNQCGSKLNFI